MFAIAALFVCTLNIHIINAQNPHFPLQMPQYHAGGLPFPPVLKEFSPQRPLSSTGSQRCVVQQFERLECGEPDITPAECEDISCCYDALGCYYGKAVTLQCTRDGQFVLVVARDSTMPPISLDSIHMLEDDPGQCAPVGSTASFAIYQFAVSACGTTMKEESGLVIYENMMSSAYEVGMGSHGSITRDRAYKLKFQCRYSGTAVEALVVEVKTVPPPLPISQQGPLQVELRLASGQCNIKGCSDEDMYTSYYTDSDYPVTKALREPVDVEVRILDTTDPSITLVLERCWATSAPEALSLPQWNLVDNGCPYNDDHHLNTMLSLGSSGLQFPSHYKRFIVKMFTFVDQSSHKPLQQRIFIHCTTSVCRPSSSESCETICDHGTKSFHPSEEKCVVSSGEIILVSSLPVSDNLVKEQGMKEHSEMWLDFGLWAAGALTVFALCGFTVAVLTNRLKPRPQPAPV